MMAAPAVAGISAAAATSTNDDGVVVPKQLLILSNFPPKQLSGGNPRKPRRKPFAAPHT